MFAMTTLAANRTAEAKVRKSKVLASLALLVVTLAGASAFAESRPSNETRSRRGARSADRHGYRSDGHHGHSRGGSYHSSRRPYHAHGRISRFAPYGGGYHVWLDGAAYPFHVPRAYWSPDRFRVGVTIGLGGYYNPLGYYDYWDGYRHRSPYYRGSRGLSDPDLLGVVDRVDYARDTFVIRDDATGELFTIVLRNRRESLPGVGDYVAVRGDWTTQGYFRAYDVDFLD